MKERIEQVGQVSLTTRSGVFQGNRKLIVTLIGFIGAMYMQQNGIQLDDNTLKFLWALIAAFYGVNSVEHGKDIASIVTDYLAKRSEVIGND